MSSDLMRQVGEQANRHNPWPLYAQLRRDRVVPLADGSYAVGRYDDVLALLHDPRVSSDAHTLTDPGDRIVLDIAPFINRDPPDHGRLRRVATRFFGPPDSPGLVTGQEPEIRRQIDALISAFPESGEVDVVDHFAYPLPVAVICRLLGVPPADEPQFRVWAGQLVGALDAANLEDSEDAVKTRNEALLALFGYLGDLVKKHRDSPDGSMLSGLANDDEADAMSDMDLVVTSGLLLIAGHETTVNLIANGTLTLLRNPDTLARLRRDPGWVIPVVEELLARAAGAVPAQPRRARGHHHRRHHDPQGLTADPADRRGQPRPEPVHRPRPVRPGPPR